MLPWMFLMSTTSSVPASGCAAENPARSSAGNGASRTGCRAIIGRFFDRSVGRCVATKMRRARLRGVGMISLMRLRDGPFGAVHGVRVHELEWNLLRAAGCRDLLEHERQ